MWILYIVGIFFIFYLLGALFEWVGKLIERRQQKIQEQVANELNSKYNIEQEIVFYRNKLNVLLPKDSSSYATKQMEAQKLLYEKLSEHLGLCPKCKIGKLKVIKRFPYFIGCTEYPKCKYRADYYKALREARIEVKRNVKMNSNNSFIDDFKKAYQNS